MQDYPLLIRHIADRAETVFPQRELVGTARVFVVPSPSGANARTSIATQAIWYDRLAEFLHDDARSVR